MSLEQINEDKLLLEVLDTVKDPLLKVMTVLKDKWTWSRQYYIGYYNSGSSTEYFLIRFENRWHEGATRIGKNAQSVTVHPVNIDKGLSGKIHKTVKVIKKPLKFVSMLIKAFDIHHESPEKAEGYILFLEPQFEKYGKLVTRGFRRSSLKSSMTSGSLYLSGDDEAASGMIFYAHKKGLKQDQVFKNMFSKLNKTGTITTLKLTLEVLAKDPEFVMSVAKNMKMEKRLSGKLKFDLNSIHMEGKDTDYNEEFRKIKPVITKTPNINMRKSWVELKDESFSKFDSENDNAYRFSVSMTDRIGGDFALHTNIVGPSMESPIKQFTGSGYRSARDFMVGEYNDGKGKELNNGLDNVFKKIGHSLDGYKGFIFRGISLRRTGKDEDKMPARLQGLLRPSVLALATYTSFSSSLGIAASFGGMEKHIIKEMVIDSGDRAPSAQWSWEKYGFFTSDKGTDILDLIVEKARENGYPPVPDEPWSDGNNDMAWLPDVNVLLYSKEVMKEIKVVVPGEASSIPSEAEIIVARGSLMVPLKYTAWKKTKHANWQIAIECKFESLDGLTETESVEENMNNQKTLESFLSEAKKGNKNKSSEEREAKVDKDLEKYFASLSKEELKDKKLKFGSSIF